MKWRVWRAALARSSQLVVMRRLVTAVALTSKAPAVAISPSASIFVSLPLAICIPMHMESYNNSSNYNNRGRPIENWRAYFLIFFLRRLAASFAALACVHIHHAWQATYALIRPLSSLFSLPSATAFMHMPRAVASSTLTSTPTSTSFLPAAQLYLESLCCCRCRCCCCRRDATLSSTWSLTQFVLHCLNGNAKSPAPAV